MSHAPHPDVQTHGLADDCPDCDEAAEAPVRNLDDPTLLALLRLAVDRDRLFLARSGAEALATARILTTLEHVGRLCEVGGPVVAQYLRDRWNLEATIERRP